MIDRPAAQSIVFQLIAILHRAEWKSFRAPTRKECDENELHLMAFALNSHCKRNTHTSQCKRQFKSAVQFSEFIGLAKSLWHLFNSVSTNKQTNNRNSSPTFAVASAKKRKKRLNGLASRKTDFSIVSLVTRKSSKKLM